MAKAEGIEKLLAEHPLFEGMTAKELKTVAGCGRNERFEAGDFLAREGDSADNFFLIRAGSVALEFEDPGGDGIMIESLHAGEVVGWSWMVAPHLWSSDVRAMELTRVISVDAACLRGKMTKDPVLGFALFSRFAPIIAERLRNAHRQLTDMYSRK